MEKESKISEASWGRRLEFKAGASFSDDNYIQIIESIAEALRGSKSGKVIVDARGVRRHVSLFKMIEAIDHLRRLPVIPRIAIISPELKKDPDSSFMTTAAMNRGICISYHDTEEEALAQILNQRHPLDLPPRHP